MNIVIHPTYFSNIAHFVAMVKSNEVILEMDDNFVKQTYRNRTYIYGANGKLALNIPVVHSQKNRQKYRDVQIFNVEKWQNLHWKSLVSAYGNSPFFEYYEHDLRPLFELKTKFILDFNLKCFDIICKSLQIELIINKTKTYNNTIDSATDLRNLVNVKQEPGFKFDNYTQVFNNKHNFIPNLSILDLLFNEGPNSVNYLTSQSLLTL